jgi:acyl dehydratase
VKQSAPYDIEVVREEWVGKTGPVLAGRYPVEYDAIRRHCHMVEDENPLFIDEEFASNTLFGGVIAPPVMLDYFAGMGVWPKGDQEPLLLLQVPTRGDRYINLNQHMEFFHPVHVGDRLSRQQVIVDVQEKSIRLDPKAIWITVETRITNEDAQLVATIRNTNLSHREPAEVASDQ